MGGWKQKIHYIKKKINYQPLKMRLIQAKSCSNIEIHKEDANQLARTVSADVVYMVHPITHVSIADSTMCMKLWLSGMNQNSSEWH